MTGIKFKDKVQGFFVFPHVSLSSRIGHESDLLSLHSNQYSVQRYGCMAEDVPLSWNLWRRGGAQ